ncbi:MAG: DUF4397 domain-containing protein [Chloroflexota bacterium]
MSFLVSSLVIILYFLMLFFYSSRTYALLLLTTIATLLLMAHGFSSYASGLLDVDAETGVRIGHFAPLTADDSPIRVEFNGTSVVDNFIYGWSTVRMFYPPGEYEVAVYEAGEEGVLLAEETFTLEADKKYTLMLIGNGVEQPTGLTLVNDTPLYAEESSAAIAFGHFAPLSGELSGTAIDIREDTGIIVRDDIQYGEFDASNIDQLTKTTTSYIVTSASGVLTFVDLQTFGYNQGDLQSLFLVGDGRNKPIRAYMYVNDGPGGFMNQTGNPMFNNPSVAFANFYNDADSEEIIFEFDQDQHTVQWGSLSPDKQYAAGSYTLTAKMTSGEVILEQQVNVGLSETVIYAFTRNNTDGAPLIVPVYGDYLATGVVPPRIRFVHLSPFTSGAFATLDVRRDNGLIVEDDLSFGKTGGFRALGPGEYTFRYTTRDGDRLLFDPDPITVEEGDNITVFLIGDGVNQLVRLVILVDEEGTLSDKSWTSPLGTFSMANLAPTGSGDATNTRIEIDSLPVTTSFGYGDFKPAAEIITGQHEVKVYDEASGALLASRVIGINASKNHLIMLIGDNVNQPYTIAFFDQADIDPISSAEATLQFGNLAIVQDNDEVNFVTKADEIFSGLNYGEFTSGAAAGLLPAIYEVTYVDDIGNAIPKNPFELDLGVSDNLILFSTGDGTRQPYGLFMMDVSGTQGGLLKDIENQVELIYFPAIFNDGISR